MAKAAKEALDAETLQVLADVGYYSSAELKACEDDGIVAYVPPPEGNGRLEKQGRFSLKDFSYDAAADAYRCPAGATAASDEGRSDQHRRPARDPLCEPQGDLRRLPVKGTLPQPKASQPHHLLAGSTKMFSNVIGHGCRRRRRADAPSFRDGRASLRHAQMPRRLSPLPGARLRQGARRMEPDGALLQLHPRAQHPRLRALRCRHRKGASVAPTRLWSSSRPASSRILQSRFWCTSCLGALRRLPRASLANAVFLPSLDGQITSDFRKSASSPVCKNISLLASPKSISPICRPVPTRGALRERHQRRGRMRWTWLAH